MNARTQLRKAYGAGATETTPAPRVLSRWPIESGEVRPAYRFAEAAVAELQEFVDGPTSGRDSEPVVTAVLKNARFLVAQVGITPDARGDMQAVEKRLGELQARIVRDTGAIVVKLLNQAQAATSEAASAFGEIGAEVSAWQKGVPIPVQERIRTFSNDWSRVMRETSTRYQVAAELYQGQLDRLLEMGQLRTGLMAKIYESFETQLAAQQAMIDDMLRNRGLLNEATARIQEALEAGLKSLNQALPELKAASRKLLMWAGGIIGGALGLGVMWRLLK